MKQVVPNRIINEQSNKLKKIFNTLLIDGSNLLLLSSLGDKTISSNGKPIGGITQFFLQLRLILQKGNFRYVYVFWDGKDDGVLRKNIYKDYKANRDKEFDDANLSDYMREVNRCISVLLRKKTLLSYKKNRNKRRFFIGRGIL